MSATSRAMRQANRLCRPELLLDNDDPSPPALLHPFRKTVAFTAEQVRAARTVPIEVVPGMAGVVLCPVRILWAFSVGAAFSASPAWALQYGGFDVNLHNTLSPVLTTLGFKYTWFGSLSAIVSSTDHRGVPLVWRSAVDITGGALDESVCTVIYDTISFDDLH
jgi:hypothetical protein